jgi:hypothetical protein
MFGISLGEGKHYRLNASRGFWKCKSSLAKKRQKLKVRNKSDEEERDHRKQACGPHRKREENP